MRVRKQHRIDAGRGKRKLAVDAAGVGAPALEQATVQQEMRVAGLDQGHRAGDCSHRTPKRDRDHMLRCRAFEAKGRRPLVAYLSAGSTVIAPTWPRDP